MKMNSSLLLALFISVAIHVIIFAAFIDRFIPAEYGVARAPSSLDIVVFKGQDKQESEETNPRTSSHEPLEITKKKTERTFGEKVEKSIRRNIKDTYVSQRKAKTKTITKHKNTTKEKIISQQKKEYPARRKQHDKENSTSKKPGGTQSLYTSFATPGTPVEIPAYLKNDPPKYPTLARRLGYEGVVILDVTVLPDGKPEKLEIEKSSGYEILDKAAVEAVREWRFKPATRGGTPISSRVKIPIKFDLKQG